MSVAEGIVIFIYSYFGYLELVALSGFEPLLLAPKANMIDRYNIGLSLDFHLISTKNQFYNLLYVLLLCLLFLLNLSPGVSESHSSVNDEFFLSCIWSNTEITPAFKLESIKWFQLLHSRFNFARREYLKGVWIQEFFKISMFLPGGVPHGK